MEADLIQKQKKCYFDSHTHLLDYPSEQLPQIIAGALKNDVFFISSNTKYQQQYEPMLKMTQQYSHPIEKLSLVEGLPLQRQKVTIIPSFGIHPCFIQHQEANQNWIEHLQKLLNVSPWFGVGEIGIDFRTATLETNSKQQQTSFFIKQLQLAFRMNRTVTVHCVRAYGDILKHFKQYHKLFQATPNSQEEGVKGGLVYRNTPIIMHSYGGSKQITHSLLKLNRLNLFFSLSLKRSEELCKVIPLNKLLLQTDAPYQPNLSLLQKHNIFPDNISQADQQSLEKTNRVEFVKANYSSLCNYYELSPLQFTRAILTNSLKAFKLIL